ncbi:hypothetical protein IE81DRAFT_37241 [Ceraceosorus guamensis]|uniref:Uncharacterized protein n=1 Tax=Ceraceosorus guamensis TaxID=1522189 RepID=A0A316W901_9BASI|nr:hypothetical protein IE81DRAFT_37241 [Ceraceosorus guamensis]PWN44185.1 hypothetical protein IE81DRAFT_37241 [Ceraceosorus guamensis]
MEMDTDTTVPTSPPAGSALKPENPGAARRREAEAWLETFFQKKGISALFDGLITHWRSCDGPGHPHWRMFKASAKLILGMIHAHGIEEGEPDSVRRLMRADGREIEGIERRIETTDAQWLKRRNDRLEDWDCSRWHVLNSLCTLPQSNPAINSQRLELDYDKLQREFYDQSFLGDHDATFADVLEGYERQLTPGQKAAVEEMPTEQLNQPSEGQGMHNTTSKFYHSRSLAIVQSSGTGKSRLVQQLNGHTFSRPEGVAVHLTFYLCFRRKDEDGFPYGDWRFYKWVSEDLFHDSVPPDLRTRSMLPILYNIRWITLFRAIYRASAEEVRKIEGRQSNETLAEEWKKRSAAPTEVPAGSRHEAHQFVHLYNQTEVQAQDLWSSVLELATKCNTAADLLAGERNLLSVDAEELRKLLAQTHDDQVWFHICLDELANASWSGVPREPAGTTNQFAWVEDLRALFCPDENIELPPRFWLIMLGTNASFSALNPAVHEASSSRISRGQLKHFPPYMHCVTNVWLANHPTEHAQIMRASPYAASRPHILALWGRPLWKSLVEYENPLHPIQAGARLELCGIGLAVILGKLLRLSLRAPDLSRSNLDKGRLFALLSQRIELDNGSELDSLYHRHATASAAEQKRQVDRHLRVLCDATEAGDAVVTYTMCEPLVSHMAAAVMGNASPVKPGDDVRTLWATCWDALHSLVSTQVIMTRGSTAR